MTTHMPRQPCTTSHLNLGGHSFSLRNVQLIIGIQVRGLAFPSVPRRRGADFKSCAPPGKNALSSRIESSAILTKTSWNSSGPVVQLLDHICRVLISFSRRTVLPCAQWICIHLPNEGAAGVICYQLRPAGSLAVLVDGCGALCRSVVRAWSRRRFKIRLLILPVILSRHCWADFEY